MKKTAPVLFLTAMLLAPLAALHAVEPFLEMTDVFPAGMNGIGRYRIPGITDNR